VSAAIGFRIKSGWANAVLLGGSLAAPQVLDRRRVELSDPADPALRQPYHAAMGVGLTDEATLARRIKAVERYSDASCSRIIAEYRTMAGKLAGAALVVGSDTNPEQIANQHIRAHACEARLFRRVVQEGAKQAGLVCSVRVEKSLLREAAQVLGMDEMQLKETLTRLGRGMSGGWRGDDKLATMAAWLLLLESHP
jgi:hypothetical protein